MHIAYEIESHDLPADCILECSASGPVDDAVSEWVDRLDLTVDRRNAKAYLRGFGSWDDHEIDAMSGHGLAEKILWLAAGDFADGQDLVILEN